MTEIQATEPQVMDTQATETNAKETQAMETKATKTKATKTKATENAGDEASVPKVQKRKAIDTSQTTTRRATRSMTTDAARQAVLQTDELLDAILVNLPMKQLFVIQRVSKRFKAIIAAIPAIQEKMFLRPSKGPVETWTIDEATYTSAGLASDISGVRKITRTPVTLNPMLDDECRWDIQDVLLSSNMSKTLKCRPFLAKQQISLLDTHISDPPCHRAFVDFRVTFGNNATTERQTTRRNSIFLNHTTVAESETGLTLRNVLDTKMDQRSIVYWVPPRGRAREQPDETLRKAINQMENAHGAACVVGVLVAMLDNVIVPSAEDWAAVRNGEYGDQIVTDKPMSRSSSSNTPQN